MLLFLSVDYRLAGLLPLGQVQTYWIEQILEFCVVKANRPSVRSHLLRPGS